MPTRRLLLALPFVAALPAAAQPASREITWDELVPKNWDPMKEFREMNFGVLSDADPRAQALLKKMREVWDNAPVNNAMDNQRVKLPGYVVPLDDSAGTGLKEFLLVPYFGACIHTPPPPANQIIHVQAEKRVPVRSMDVVWASGLLRTLRTDSVMGVASYRLEAAMVEPYVVKPGAPAK